MRYFVEFAYNGSDFHGSQSQPNGITVQATMEQAFATILREPIALTFAGRTDAGVHARQMFAHFDTNISHAILNTITPRLNNLLPASIAIARIFPVADDLHARFSARSRTYEYHIRTSKDPFAQGFSARVTPDLDFDRMNEAAQSLLGKQDFASFCRVHTDVKTTFCTVFEAYWKNNVFTITADRFLRNMVRAIVGTLIEVGRGRLTPEQFREIIAAHNRCKAGQSAPAEGLYLTHIEYDF